MKATIRYAWIEACQRMLGHIPKKRLVHHFGISNAQMSNDIRFVAEAMRERGADVTIRAGRIEGTLPDEAVFTGISFTDIVRSGALGCFTSIDRRIRSAHDDIVLAKIIESATCRRTIRVSITNLEGKIHQIEMSAHHVLEVSGELYVRFFDHVTSNFRTLPVENILEFVRYGDVGHVSSSMDKGFRLGMALPDKHMVASVLMPHR